MNHRETFTSEQYDTLKIFLISNFNVFFLKSNKPDVEESFEITLSDGTIMGHFLKNNFLELRYSGNVTSAYEKIIEKIHQLNGNTENPTSHTINDFSDLDDLLNHISTCDSCKAKLLEILNHAKTL